MKDKLYYKDGYQTKLSTVVMSCEAKGENFVVTLKESIFYPEGGGQPADIGTIGNVDVIDVHERGGMVLHTVTGKLTVGEQVDTKINWDYRFTNMQHHSGEHIVSGLVYKHFGYDNVGFHMGEHHVTMDFNGELTPQDIEKIEQLANDVVYSNIPTTICFPSEAELNNMEFRSKKDLHGEVRIVGVGNADVCACCGTHVSYSGEIGIIRLLGGQKYKGGTRVTMICGKRAMRDYVSKDKVLTSIAVELSTKPEQCLSSVEKLLEQIALQKQTIATLREESFKNIAEHVVDNSKYIVLWEAGFVPNELRMLATAVSQKISGACVVLSGNDENGYQYAIASEHLDLRAESKQINKDLSGRGGGTPLLVQGSFKNTKDNISSYFKAL